MKKNYLMFMTSLMADGRGPIHYEVPNFKTSFDCVQTNLPATEYVATLLHQREEKLTKIIMLCSDEVMTKGILLKDQTERITTYEYYKQIAGDYLTAYGYTQEELDSLFVPFYLRDINPGDRDSMQGMLSGIKEAITNPSDSELFLDFTGGLRSASMLQLFYARQLESFGLKINYVLYSNQQQGEIENCIDTYRVFDFLDAYNDMKHGDISGLVEQAHNSNSEDLEEAAKATKKIISDAKTGKFITEDDAKRRVFQPKQGASVEEYITAELINRQIAASTRTGKLSTHVSSGDVVQAAQLIREQGLRMLEDSGYMIWNRENRNINPIDLSKTAERRKNHFSAYSYYYHSYTEFVYKMLLHAKASKDKEEFRQLTAEYIERGSKLFPATRIQSTSPVIEKEFDRHCRTLCDRMKQLLVEKVHSNSAGPEQIIAAVTDYERERKSYITTYAVNGFPFGNIMGNWSYTQCGSQNYPTEYQKALRAALEQLYRMDFDEMMKTVYEMLADNCILSRYFPAVHMRMLFSLRDNDFTVFSSNVLLMDAIRKKRNLFTHSGENATKEDEMKMLGFAEQFLQWLSDISRPQ